MDKICKNCIHWKYTNEYPVSGYKFKAGICNNDKFVYEPDSDMKIDGLTYWDSEGYFAGFRTGEEFGCVHFKQR